jgi:TatD DNase family protein
MQPPLVDSHCHLNFEPLGTSLDSVLRNARDSGVGHMLCVSVTIEKFPEVRGLAHNHDSVFASVGVHPNERDVHEPTVEELVHLANDTRVVAIGETGLDYYRSQGDLAWQHERFRRHIRAARRCRKPLIIHTRDAAQDTLRIMTEEGAGEVGGVMHCFTESWEVARQALDMDFHVSFSGIVTFRTAEPLREVARQVPLSRLLVETDAPYLAPVPHRGKTNEPAFVRYVAECVSEVRGQNVTAVAAATTDNFFRLFSAARRCEHQGDSEIS